MPFIPNLFDGSLPGDAILYPVTPKSEFISRTVAAAQLLLGLGHGLEGFSHIAIKSDRPGYQWEAKVPWVGEYKIDTSRIYETWRICDLSDEQRIGILRECRARKGNLYNLTGLFTDGRIILPHTEVCSQLFDETYRGGAHVRMNREGGRMLAPDEVVDYPGARMLCRHKPVGKER